MAVGSTYLVIRTVSSQTYATVRASAAFGTANHDSDTPFADGWSLTVYAVPPTNNHRCTDPSIYLSMYSPSYLSAGAEPVPVLHRIFHSPFSGNLYFHSIAIGIQQQHLCLHLKLHRKQHQQRACGRVTVLDRICPSVQLHRERGWPQS